MDEDGEDRLVKNRQDPNANSSLAMGPIFLMWEGSLEKLKILNYERDYCKKLNRKFFNRVHFAVQGSNPIIQFDDFIGICTWLISDITKKNDLFKKEEFDDPNIVVNKLIYALTKIDPEFRLPTPNQKLKAAYGEAVCTVLEFLTDKALGKRGFQWSNPIHVTNEEIEQAEPVDDVDDPEIDDDVAAGVGAIEEDQLFEENARLDSAIDSYSHTILQQYQDPVEWKTELERVGPRLRANQQVSTNEWRSHVDQTINSKGQIEKVLGETQGTLQTMNKQIAEDLTRMKQKEKYLNNAHNSLCLEFTEVKHKFEELEKKNSTVHESVTKFTNELAEISEKLDDLKESIDSKDSGINDTSPLVKIKAALQQIKAEIQEFDMRIGVVSHSLLTAKVSDTNRSRSAAVNKARQRHNKNKRDNDDNSMLSGDD